MIEKPVKALETAPGTLFLEECVFLVYGHRKWWSWFILGWISILISFNMGLALLVGFRPYGFNFDKLPWFATSITAETFIQIVGLGTIAAHYLFSNEQKQDKRLRVRFSR